MRRLDEENRRGASCVRVICDGSMRGSVKRLRMEWRWIFV